MQLRNRIVGSGVGSPARSTKRANKRVHRAITPTRSFKKRRTAEPINAVAFEDSILCKLPVELRLQIYTYVIDDEEIASRFRIMNKEAIMNRNTKKTTIASEPVEVSILFESNHHTIQSSLLQICRGIRTEAVDAFRHKIAIVAQDKAVRRARVMAFKPYIWIPAVWDLIEQIEQLCVWTEEKATGLELQFQYTGSIALTNEESIPKVQHHDENSSA
ncbi:MAG: hypothetical protein Q9169_007994 [Polycauliona sp. 2 TL-2023]